MSYLIWLEGRQQWPFASIHLDSDTTCNHSYFDSDEDSDYEDSSSNKYRCSRFAICKDTAFKGLGQIVQDLCSLEMLLGQIYQS